MMRAGIAVPREPELVGSFPTEERVSGTSPGNPIYREGPHATTVISMGTTPSSTISSCLAAA